MSSPELIVALDFPSEKEAMSMARTLAGHVRWLKVGLELFCRTGPTWVQRLKDMGFHIFLDLKFMDIPHTVQGAVASACAAGADMLTIHLLGGQAAAKAACQSVREAEHPPVLLGVTVLTSMCPADLALLSPAQQHPDLTQTVLTLAVKAQTWGLDGIVCSGQEVADIRQHCRTPFTLVTPGIRLGDPQKNDDQQRVTTPQAAVSAGSDYLVVGRPITRSSNPLQSAHSFLNAIKE
ncbi:MAG: orotidine-5'-phosphate decarboxylase [Deltaproteobacteria bacterium]|nr:MAG: orotidine-5'-phosphate decarboxylase [Deltaproteobacteria bacterium]